MCETERGIEVSGGCARDEYCAGLNSFEDAICGKTNLCTKKGENFQQFIV